MPAVFTYVGSDNGGVFSGGVVSWTLPSVAPGAGGTVCFWGVVNGLPCLPLAPETRFVALPVDTEGAERSILLAWTP